MMTKKGIYLGILDGKMWYLTYPRDGVSGEVSFNKGDNIMDRKWYELEGKAEVDVRVLPGT